MSDPFTCIVSLITAYNPATTYEGITFSFKHAAFTYHADSSSHGTHVGEAFDIPLPTCAGGDYSRTDFHGDDQVQVYEGWAYVFNRFPSDAKCRDEIANRYQEWKFGLERSSGKTIQQLWR